VVLRSLNNQDLEHKIVKSLKQKALVHAIGKG
jgi:hypothetical protein